MSTAEEGLKLAAAYREAAEADTMQTMNVQSSGKGLDDLLFYIVPVDWYRRLWKLLLQPNANVPDDWRDQMDDLPDVQPWYHHESNAVTNETKSPWGSPTTAGTSSKQHEKDFVLVGSNVWGLLSNKFGSGDSAVACHVVSLPSQDSSLAVNLPDATRIPIPGSGRFPYETFLQQQAEDDKDDVAMQDGTAANKVEEEDDQTEGSKNPQEGPILMLPPSTTPQSPRSPRSQATSHAPTLRQYGSGLANLGNTCFMSSTIQCLGHASPVLKYFLSGSFLADLNKDNPLGTGGDLAIEFSKLLREIWVDEQHGSSRHLGYVSNNVVYPRRFKVTVGKHAEQFSGYDQHDSQEFATYLLDALHEDTNRISKKPYIEKPEQGENETDEEAANKAWELHLQRENSHILDFFMGQVKSRVQCCEENCGRVSTTFDPFMYLSVPIPGTEDRQMKVVFIPLNPQKRPTRLTLVVPKTGSVLDLIKKCRERILSWGVDASEIAEEDMVAIDAFQGQVYRWYKPDDAVDVISDTDKTYIYQLRSLNEVRRLSTTPRTNAKVEDDLEASELPSSGRKYQLDIVSLRDLNQDWESKFCEYLENPTNFLRKFNPKKGTTEERVKFLNELKSFLVKCHEALQSEMVENDESTANETVRPFHSHPFMKPPSKDQVAKLVALSEASMTFQRVQSIYDVAVLEFCAGKLREEVVNIIQSKKRGLFPDGILIEIKSQRPSSYTTSYNQSEIDPLVLRIPSNMTVYELREELASRMQRSIRPARPVESTMPGEDSSETHPSPTPDKPEINGHDNAFGSQASIVMRQIPMYWHTPRSDNTPPYQRRPNQLGALAKPGYTGGYERAKRSSPLVQSSEEEEQEEVAHTIGEHGVVVLEWPEELADESFDTVEYNSFDDAKDDADVLESYNPKKAVTVLDCIDKYCQKEQLEETEMWYCNKCQKHVRAWKQFHLYRAPPILIIHLKRFQFSATTHRRDKINEFIDFPLEGLDLTQHFINWKEGENPIYDCFGVSNHFGGLGGGHYTAHALHNNGVWCYYDDTRISENVDPKDAVTKAAYVLYYRRRDVPVDLNFSISTETPEFRPAPAIILEHSDAMNGHTDSMSGSNAAVIGEDDNMEVDNLDAASRSTSPMESVGWDQQNLYGDDALPDDEAQLPRQ